MTQGFRDRKPSWMGNVSSDGKLIWYESSEKWVNRLKFFCLWKACLGQKTLLNSHWMWKSQQSFSCNGWTVYCTWVDIRIPSATSLPSCIWLFIEKYCTLSLSLPHFSMYMYTYVLPKAGQWKMHYFARNAVSPLLGDLHSFTLDKQLFKKMLSI